MKRILVLNGHPAESSLCGSLADAYAAAARRAGHEVRELRLHDLHFDSDFGRAGYGSPKPLEPDLRRVLDELRGCEHLVLVTPMWWGGLPARLKGLFDRALLPGLAFDTRRTSWGRPAPMLGGRSARVIVTSDTPGWFLRLAYRNALVWQLRGQILGFVGIRPTCFTLLSGASRPGEGVVARWLAQVGRMGARAE